MERLKLMDLQGIMMYENRIILLGSDDRQLAALFLVADHVKKIGGTVITTKQHMSLWRHYTSVAFDHWAKVDWIRDNPMTVARAGSGDIFGRIIIIDIGVSTDQIPNNITRMDYVVALDPAHAKVLNYPTYHIQDIGDDGEVYAHQAE